jgi:hypothetical protein
MMLLILILNYTQSDGVEVWTAQLIQFLSRQTWSLQREQTL